MRANSRWQRGWDGSIRTHFWNQPMARLSSAREVQYRPFSSARRACSSGEWASGAVGSLAASGPWALAVERADVPEAVVMVGVAPVPVAATTGDPLVGLAPVPVAVAAVAVVGVVPVPVA